MKTLLSFIVAFVIIHSTAVAQIVWRGGTPGQEEAWSNPRNWDQHRVPDADDIVIIPNTETRGGFYPVIDGQAGPIYYLEIQGGAKLTVTPYGSLAIDGAGKYEDAILLVGALENHGEIRVANTAGQVAAGHPEEIRNTGVFRAVKLPGKDK